MCETNNEVLTLKMAVSSTWKWQMEMTISRRIFQVN